VLCFLFGSLPISKMGIAARPAPGQRPVTPGREEFFAGRMSLQKTDETLFRFLRKSELCEAKKSEMQIILHLAL
jgi:hypothetical protein